MSGAKDQRKRAMERIRALIAKTTANGCTEAEALAAAEKVAELLALYNLSIDEVEMKESPFTQHDAVHTDDVGDRLWKVADGVCILTGARYWVSGAGVHPVEISFFGFEHEVACAAYLLSTCAGAMRRSQDGLHHAWALLTPRARRQRILPYLDGMADRLRERLIAMKPPSPTGRGLIVLRDQLIDAAMAEAGIDIKGQKARSSRKIDPAYDLGRAAAERVALNPGVTSRSSGLRLRGISQ